MTNEQFFELVSIHQNRLKVFLWSEALALTGLLPSEIILENKKVADPLFPLTQSGKNYQNMDFVIQNYSNSDLFEISKNDYGIASQFVLNTKAPQYFELSQSQGWYRVQHDIYQNSFWIRCVPMVRNVYLVGSGAMGISSGSSDTDLAFQCHPCTVLISRFWAKTLVKLMSKDSYSVRFGVVETWLRLHIWASKDKWNDKLKNLKIQEKQYRQRKGIKYDLGLFFENEQQLVDYFGYDQRQYFIHSKKRIELHNDSCFELATNISKSQEAISWVIKLSLTILTIPLLPLILLQLVFSFFRFENNPNHTLHLRFCSFFPRFPEKEFLTSSNPVIHPMFKNNSNTQ